MNSLRIRVSDIAAAKAFYTELFGSSFESLSENTYGFTYGNMQIECVENLDDETDQDRPAFNPGVLSIVTDSLHDFHQRAIDALCREVDEKLVVDRTGSLSFTMTDPFGNKVRFIQAKAHAA
ncbi:MAG: VOC family protein [Cyclobacteriaceae bacterium]